MHNPFQKIYRSKEYGSVLSYRKNPSLFPFIVDIELTNHCNLKCLFCGQQNMKRKKGFMTKKIFKKVVDECVEYNTPIRLIRWGEPFLHPKIIEYCRYIKKKLLLHITTNGLLLNVDNMQALVSMEVDSIIFSFQGATKPGYEQMRGEHYDLLERNIKKLLKIRGEAKKPYIQISSTMTNEPQKQINAFIKKWSIVDAVAIGKTNLSRIPVCSEVKKQETIKHKYRPCTEIYQKLSVDWDGKISCCCSDWDRFMMVGDIKNQTLCEIWNKSNQLKTFRKILDDMGHSMLPMCKNCFHTYEGF